MKLLFCQDCNDIIAPYPIALQARACLCRRHHVWWRSPETGLISVHDAEDAKDRAWILGVTNMFLYFELERVMTADDITEIIDAHEPSYLFKSQRSCIVRIRPGSSRDSKWEDVVPPKQVS